MTGEHWETTGGDLVDIWESHGLWFWHVEAPHHEVVEQGEGYVDRSGAVDAALRHHPRVGTPDD